MIQAHFCGNSAERKRRRNRFYKAMAEKYEVDESVAADDLDRFLQQLRNAEILEETNE